MFRNRKICRILPSNACEEGKALELRLEVGKTVTVGVPVALEVDKDDCETDTVDVEDEDGTAIVQFAPSQPGRHRQAPVPEKPSSQRPCPATQLHAWAHAGPYMLAGHTAVAIALPELEAEAL